MKIQIFKLEKVAAEAGNRRLINLKSKNYPEWNEFEFITRKNGANGPSKTECLQYGKVFSLNTYSLNEFCVICCQLFFPQPILIESD